MGEINVVPYIDVMLVLLIIFMVTAPLLTQGVEVNLPEASAEPLDQDLVRDNQPLVLSVDVEGQLFLNVGNGESEPREPGQIVSLAAAALRRFSFGLVNKICGALMIGAAMLLASKDFEPER